MQWLFEKATADCEKRKFNRFNILPTVYFTKPDRNLKPIEMGTGVQSLHFVAVYFTELMATSDFNVKYINDKEIAMQ